MTSRDFTEAEILACGIDVRRMAPSTAPLRQALFWRWALHRLETAHGETRVRWAVLQGQFGDRTTDDALRAGDRANVAWNTRKLRAGTDPADELLAQEAAHG